MIIDIITGLTFIARLANFILIVGSIWAIAVGALDKWGKL